MSRRIRKEERNRRRKNQKPEEDKRRKSKKEVKIKGETKLNTKKKTLKDILS